VVKKMSDTVTNAEVEDVLSSIRRLVSEDKRPLHVSQGDKSSDRLVLTPALRVAEDHEPEVAELTAPDSPDHEHSGTAKPADFDATPPLDQGNVDQEAASLGDDDFSFDDPAHDYSDDPYGFLEDESEEANTAADPHTDEQATEDASVQPNEPDHQSAEEGEESAEQQMDDQISDVALGERDHEIEQGTPELVQSPTSKADALRAKIEELEAAIGGISANWSASGTPSDVADPALSKDAMAWEDESPEDAIKPHFHSYDAENDVQQDCQDGEDVSIADGVEALSENTQETSEISESNIASEDRVPTSEPDGFDYFSDTQLIDEEALRDMVGEIVRAELQGALGERITRNVRKLVRREIHRALTAQDLE
jgi:hypothetical protein